MNYRARPEDGCAWVTGASSGIGRAVALELARRGYQVFATARRAEALQALVAEASGLRGLIVAAPGDVTDRDVMARLGEQIETARPIVLTVLNAGGAFTDAVNNFGGDGFQRTFALNVQGVANGVNSVLGPMRKRRRGQIVIVGSVAGYGGLPGTYAYAPSKAAVISMAVGLKFQLHPFGIRVQIANPGYIRTPLTAANIHPMPLLMEADAAARRLCDGMERGGFEIRFPRRFAWMARALNLLPYPVYFWLLTRFSGR